MATLLRTLAASTVCVLFSSALAWPQPDASGHGPTVKHLVALEYPWLARLAVLQGKVELTLLVLRARNGNWCHRGSGPWTAGAGGEGRPN